MREVDTGTARLPWIYMLRAYQSPSSGWHCGPQWAQMPNFASRNHSGIWYCLSDSQVGANLPGATGSASVFTMTVGVAVSERLSAAKPDPAATSAPRSIVSRGLGVVFILWGRFPAPYPVLLGETNGDRPRMSLPASGPGGGGQRPEPKTQYSAPGATLLPGRNDGESEQQFSEEAANSVWE